MQPESPMTERCFNLMAVGRHELARSLALDSLSGGVEDGELLLAAAQCTAELEGWKAGVPLYRRALAANPTFRVRLGAAHGLGRADVVDDSLRLFDSLLTESPDLPGPRGLMADVLLSAPSLSGDESNLDRVEQLLEEELKLSPESHLVHLHTARLAIRRERYDEARSAIERSLAIDPESPAGLRMLGTVGMLEGADNQKSLELLQSAVRANPSDGTTAQLADMAKMRVLVDTMRPLVEQDRVRRRRHKIASNLGIGAMSVGLLGFLLIGLGKIGDSPTLELVGLVIALAGCGVAMVLFVVIDRLEKAIKGAG